MSYIQSSPGGSPGAAGPPGPPGQDGVVGDDGVQGPSGTQGATGAQGPAGGGGGSWAEVEFDFGSAPTWDAQFTITDAAITDASKKVQVIQSGKVATGRVAGDEQWDTIQYAANPGTGSATVYALAFPGPVVGKRKAQYAVA